MNSRHNMTPLSSRWIIWLPLLVLLALLLSSCQGDAEPTPVALAQGKIAKPAVTTPSGDAASGGVALPSPSPTVPATSVPSPTAPATATSTPAPTATSTPTATPTPVPQAFQLTSGGCCTQPFWSPDSQQVRFIDRPSANSPVGIWGVSIAEPQTEPTLVSQRLEESIAEPDYLVETSSNTTVIERLADGERWTVPADGRSVVISPNKARIAWSVSNDNVAVENRVAAIWIANLDGSEARQVATLPRGGLSGWVSDDVLLLSSRESLQSSETVLSALSLVDGTLLELARGDRLRSQLVSPSGQWVVYYNTFAADPAQNGLWLVRTDGSQRVPLDKELFGAYQWRGCSNTCAPEDDRLLIVPFRPDAPFHEFWELDPRSGDIRQLIDADLTPLKIANGDWRVSPDGRHVVYVEARDRNLWAIELPE